MKALNHTPTSTCLMFTLKPTGSSCCCTTSPVFNSSGYCGSPRNSTSTGSVTPDCCNSDLALSVSGVTNGAPSYQLEPVGTSSIPDSPAPKYATCRIASRSSAQYTACRTILLSNGGAVVFIAM